MAALNNVTNVVPSNNSGMKQELIMKYEGKGYATDNFGNKYFQNGNGYIKLPQGYTPKNAKSTTDEKTR